MTAFSTMGEDRGAAEFDVGDEHVDVGAQVQRGVKLVEGRGGADDHELVAVREHGAQERASVLLFAAISTRMRLEGAELENLESRSCSRGTCR